MRKTKIGGIRPTLCYIGDLPRERISGITLSFEHNLRVLSEDYEIISTPEKFDLGSGFFSSLVIVFAFWKRSFLFISKHKPNINYINLPVSHLGIIKLWGLLYLIKNQQTSTVLHVHRGDFMATVHSSTFFRWIIKSVIKKVNKIIVLSDEEKTSLNAKLNTPIFSTLKNTVDIPSELPHIQNDDSKFLYLSNYLETKGIYDLLEVFSEFTDHKYSIECFGSFANDNEKGKLKSFSSENISINGPLNNDEKFNVLNRSKCLILPSWNEGQPLVILEAMALGIPIIATDVGYIRKMVGADYPHLIPPKNKEALKNSIIRISEAENLVSIGNDLKKRFDKYYNPNIHKKELLDIFKSLKG